MKILGDFYFVYDFRGSDKGNFNMNMVSLDVSADI